MECEGCKEVLDNIKLTEELSKAREDIETIQNDLNKALDMLSGKDSEINHLKNTIKELLAENESIRNENSKLTKELEHYLNKEDDVNTFVNDKLDEVIELKTVIRIISKYI